MADPIRRELIQQITEIGAAPIDTDACSKSQRVDGPRHSWSFDGDDPYIVCVYCREMRDAISGQVICRG